MLRFILYSVTLSVLLLKLSASDTSERPYGYKNHHDNHNNVLPNDWHNYHGKCYGERQSPINIDFRQTEFDSSLKEIVIETQADSQENQWNIINNGHTVKLSPITSKHSFNMGSDTFEFIQMHFHWRGSEHFINGNKFAGELHLVHQSKTNPNKYAVIGFLLQLSNYDNADLKPIINEIEKIRDHDANDIMQDKSFRLERLVPTKISNYYRYSGSLTTPGCDEIVEWVVVDAPIIPISEEQLLEFQSLRDKNGYPLLTNSRPIQNVNNRKVRRSFYPMTNGKNNFGSGSGFSAANNLQNYVKYTVLSVIFSLLLI